MAQLCTQFKTVANRLWPKTCVQAPPLLHLPTLHCRISLPTTHQLLHLNSTDEDTNKTDGMFLCMTQNGEMCTIGTAPRFFRRIVEFGHHLEQRQHVDELLTRESLAIIRST